MDTSATASAALQSAARPRCMLDPCCTVLNAANILQAEKLRELERSLHMT